MGGAIDRNKAQRLLHSLESGLNSTEAETQAQELDPVLVYFIVRFLREVYPVDNPAASAVLTRVMKLTQACPGLVAKSKAGERDPVARWFASEHSFREFRGRGRELIELVVDKLEG